MNSRAALLLFLHIPKSAGNTLIDVLRKNYRLRDSFYVTANSNIEDDLCNMPVEKLQSLQLISGHMPFGCHKFVPNRPYTYITMLRHPVERVISYYYHVLRDKTNRSHRNVLENKITLQEFVRGHFMPRELDNGITRYFSGEDPHRWETGKLTSDVYNRARRNLQDPMVHIGICEYFQESLEMFQKIFGWRDITFKIQNIGTNRPDITYTEEIAKCIEHYNAYDLALYNMALNQFHENLP